MHYLIIGGGPAGFSAAAALRRIDQNSRVTILAKEKFRPYSKIALAYLLSGEVEESLLFLPMPPEINIVLGEEAVEIDPGKCEVKTASGKKFFYDKLLVATGAEPLRPNVEGSRLPFVFTIRELPDVRGVRELLRERKRGHAVVAGAGPVGLELSDSLHKMGLTITLVISSDRVFSTMLDRPGSAFLERALSAQGVEILKNTDVVKILPSGEVLMSSGVKRMCDVVIFGKGVTPGVQWLAGSGISVRQGIPVNERQETGIPGIYAAGDVAETRDIVYGEARVNALWPVAFEQGRVAAHNMAARPLAYEGSFSRNILRVFGTSILAAGMGRADGLEVHCEDGPHFYRKIVLDQGILKGFIFVGEVEHEGLYVDLLRRRMPVASFANSLLRGSYNYARFLRQCTRQ